MEDETDVHDQNLAGCNFNQECCDFLYEVLVIFRDDFISNNCILMEVVLQEFKTRWDTPHYYIFVCASDFGQACMDLSFKSSFTSI